MCNLIQHALMLLVLSVDKNKQICFGLTKEVAALEAEKRPVGFAAPALMLIIHYYYHIARQSFYNPLSRSAFAPPDLSRLKTQTAETRHNP